MNSSQINSLVRTVLKVTGSALAAHGATQAASWINAEDVSGLVLMIVGLLWSHFHHGEKDGQQMQLPIKLVLFAPLLGVLACSGCMSQAALVRALAKDQATVSATVSTPYGTAKLVRVGGTTNTVTVGADGTVTVGK